MHLVFVIVGIPLKFDRRLTALLLFALNHRGAAVLNWLAGKLKLEGYTNTTVVGFLT